MMVKALELLVRCMVCGGEHEPRADVCDSVGMDREITRLGAKRWNGLTAHVSIAAKAKAARDEVIVQELLGRWVSELEPAVVYRSDGEILGLTLADYPAGTADCWVLRK